MKLSYTLLFLAGVQQKVLVRLPTKLPTILEANVCPVATAVNVETFDDTWETRRYIGLRELRNVLGNSVTTRVYQGKRKRPVTARSINCSRLRCGSRAPALDEPSCFFSCWPAEQVTSNIDAIMLHQLATVCCAWGSCCAIGLQNHKRSGVQRWVRCGPSLHKVPHTSTQTNFIHSAPKMDDPGTFTNGIMLADGIAVRSRRSNAQHSRDWHPCSRPISIRNRSGSDW